jgi:ABC-type transport system involved in multi-copper enzyme maturation permease subunit
VSVLPALIRNEALKAVKRPAFLVGLAIFGSIDGVGFGYNLYASRQPDGQPFALPAEWASILGEASRVPVMFGAVIAILLIASEFSWRTARQNVIDGLSRSEWYWGKAAATAAILTSFCLLHILLGASLALIGTPAGSEAVFTSRQLIAIGSVLLSVLGYAALALFVATLVRGTGAAMAVWLVWVMLAEGILRFAIGRIWEDARPYMTYAPVHAFDEARNYLMYDPAAFELAAARRAAAELPLPTVGDPSAYLLAVCLWTTGFVVAGWLLFRRRDL